MRYIKAKNLYCFSPPVMIATFCIELSAAVYVFYRYKLTQVARLSIAILVCLALFQVAEYNVCEGAFGISSLAWAKLGYVAITLLPPLGLHLGSALAGKSNRWLTIGSYVTAAGFAAYFLTIGHGMNAQQCLGNYVIFDIAQGMGRLYGLYYYGWLLAGTFFAVSQSKKQNVEKNSRALKGLALGYASFIIPTTTVNIIDPATISGIPSIMCGFAVLLALVLVLYVLPVYYNRPLIFSFIRERLPLRRDV